MRIPDPRNRAPREVVAAIIGAEVGIGVGLFAVGGTTLAPLALGVAGAAVGAGAIHARNLLLRRWLRAQLRGSA
jgi:hypothetical protein